MTLAEIFIKINFCAKFYENQTIIARFLAILHIFKYVKNIEIYIHIYICASILYVFLSKWTF